AYALSAPRALMPLSRRNSGVRQLAGSPAAPGSPAYDAIGGGGGVSCAIAYWEPTQPRITGIISARRVFFKRFGIKTTDSIELLLTCTRNQRNWARRPAMGEQPA